MSPRVAPHPCVVLGIDPGEMSGWSVWSAGVYVDSGTARVHSERSHAAGLACRLASQWDLPLVVLGEQWMPIARGKWTPRTIAGTGAQWGRWAEHLEMASVRDRQILRVDVDVWRRAVIGRARLDREGWKRRAMMIAAGYVKRVVGPDEAEAVLIGLYGTRADEVGSALPKRRRKAG